MELFARRGEHRHERLARAVRRLARQHDAEEELGIEPQADLLDHLDDVVGGEPLLPVRLIVQPVERRERHDPRVQPAVPHLGIAPALGLALRARHDDLVDPRAMELAETIEPAHGAFPKLLLAPDHEEVPIRARVEGEREAPVALAADVPVAHVVEPVVHSPAGRRRDPRHLRGGGLQPRPQLLHRDEPFVVDAEDDLLMAPPALGIPMRVGRGTEEAAAFLKIVGDLLSDVARLFAFKPAVALHEPGVLVDRDEHRELLGLREGEVLRAAPRRDVHESGAFGLAHVLPGDDPVSAHPLLGRR